MKNIAKGVVGLFVLMLLVVTGGCIFGGEEPVDVEQVGVVEDDIVDVLDEEKQPVEEKYNKYVYKLEDHKGLKVYNDKNLGLYFEFPEDWDVDSIHDCDVNRGLFKDCFLYKIFLRAPIGNEKTRVSISVLSDKYERKEGEGTFIDFVGEKLDNLVDKDYVIDELNSRDIKAFDYIGDINGFTRVNAWLKYSEAKIFNLYFKYYDEKNLQIISINNFYNRVPGTDGDYVYDGFINNEFDDNDELEIKTKKFLNIYDSEKNSKIFLEELENLIKSVEYN
jgi:hypothetical protein